MNDDLGASKINDGDVSKAANSLINAPVAPQDGVSTVSKFLGLIKPYQELVMIVTALIGTAFFIKDYFATKDEVRILRCKSDNSVAAVEHRMNAEMHSTAWIDLIAQKDNAEKAGATQTAILILQERIKEKEQERKNAREYQKSAEDRKNSGCESLAREK